MIMDINEQWQKAAADPRSQPCGTQCKFRKKIKKKKSVAPVPSWLQGEVVVVGGSFQAATTRWNSSSGNLTQGTGNFKD